MVACMVRTAIHVIGQKLEIWRYLVTYTPKIRRRCILKPTHLKSEIAEGEPLTSSANKVEKPLGARRNSHVCGSQSRGWDFADKNPTDGAPAKLKRSGPEIDASYGNVSECGDL